jgi:hypothetical protein
MTAVAAATSAPVSPTRAAIRATPADAGLLVGVRILFWIGVQLLVAGLIVALAAPRADGPINAAAGWWMVYGSVVDVATLALVVWIARSRAASYRSLLGPPAAAWQVALGTLVVLGASLPAVIFSAELTSALYGPGATPPMLSLVDVPLLAAVWSATGWPILAELAEPVAYLGIILPALERWTGRTWLAGDPGRDALGGRARLLPDRGGRRRSGSRLRRLPGGLGPAVPGDVDRAVPRLRPAAGAAHAGALDLQRRHRPGGRRGARVR